MGGKIPYMMGKPQKPRMGKPSKGAIFQEKEGLCLSQDEVHMICGMGTKLQNKMDVALKQCMPMELLTSGRAFDFEEPSERGKKKKVMKKMKGKKPSKKPSKSKMPSRE